MGEPRIGILVVAYNAASTLVDVLQRIPVGFCSRIAEVFVSDDCSSDATYFVGLGFKHHMPDVPLTVVRQERNLGYGGNQKVGYRWAIEAGIDIVVLLHGDGQYAPELLPDMVAALERGEADAVFGSRMMVPGSARRGGMPLYKYVGNRVLTQLENRALGTSLSEFHSGYRAYRTDVLRRIPFESNSDGFDFDTQIIIQLHHAGMRIKEIPIPTYYGDEICYVNGLRYAGDVLRHVGRYRLGQAGFGVEVTTALPEGAGGGRYPLKTDPTSSHGILRRWLASRPPLRVLDLGCGDGQLAAEMRRFGHHVTGVELEPGEGAERRVDRLIVADLDEGIPSAAEGPYDVVVAADVIEHLRRPEKLLREATALLAPGGVVLVSVPNFSHWYPRLRILAGRFDYDERGVLDRTHLRFFTRRSFARLARSAGLEIIRTAATGLPLEELGAPGDESRSSALCRAYQWPTAVLPSLFAYQYVFELRRMAETRPRQGALQAAPSVATARPLPVPPVGADRVGEASPAAPVSGR